MANRLSIRLIFTIICIVGILMFCHSELKKLLSSKRRVEIVKHPSQYTSKDDGFDHKKAMDILAKEHAQDNDLRLIALIRTYYIEAPATLPYNLYKPKILDPSEGQAKIVDKLLNYKEDGYFVDCGAGDGEEFSNSLFLERQRNWDGILIEVNPNEYKELKKKNRKSFTLNACLSTKPYTSVGYRGIGHDDGRYIQVQCFPLYSILLALNQTVVDYFSLDVEGAEHGVLNSIPWGKVDIKTISIAYNKWPGGKSALITYMRKRGYKAVNDITTRTAADLIFIKHKNVK